LRTAPRPAIDEAGSIWAFSLSFSRLMPHSSSSAPGAHRGFTIIEIVVVLIIIGLMMLIVIPHLFVDAKLRKARRVKDDLISLNSAIEHYALDNGKVGGTQPTYVDIRKYLDQKTDVYRLGGQDVFGDTYGPFTVGSRPTVPQKTAARFMDVVSDDFWSPFR